MRSPGARPAKADSFSDRLKEDRRYLYRYMRLGPDSCWQAAEMLIRNHTLMMASAALFNDPFDPAPIFSLQGSKEEMQAYVRGQAQRRGLSRNAAKLLERNALENWRDTRSRKQMEKSIAQDMEEDFSKRGVYCFSEEFDHVLMWSHYADNHRGIVVRFQVDPPEFDSIAASALPVAYQKSRPISRALTDDHETRFRHALLTKADLWSYEREWRLIRTDVAPGPLEIQDGTIDGIYLGARCPETHQQAILGWVKAATSHIALFHARRHDTEFRLMFRQVYPEKKS